MGGALCAPPDMPPNSPATSCNESSSKGPAASTECDAAEAALEPGSRETQNGNFQDPNAPDFAEVDAGESMTIDNDPRLADGRAASGYSLLSLASGGPRPQPGTGRWQHQRAPPPEEASQEANERRRSAEKSERGATNAGRGCGCSTPPARVDVSQRRRQPPRPREGSLPCPYPLVGRGLTPTQAEDVRHNALDSAQQLI